MTIVVHSFSDRLVNLLRNSFNTNQYMFIICCLYQFLTKQLMCIYCMYKYVYPFPPHELLLEMYVCAYPLGRDSWRPWWSV